MIEGVIWALVAGVMLGLYALPEKFVKNYKYENTWALFFLMALVVFPVIVAFSLINNFGSILGSIPSDTLMVMIGASVLWGIGVQMWSKAIDYIGVSLGFSIFIGAVILIGSTLPFIVDGLPTTNALTFIAAGLFVILLGIFANGRAGILRKEADEQKEHMEQLEAGKVARGIIIALVGGLFATGFSLANAVGVAPITKAVVGEGNPEWMSAIAVMFVIYVSGAIYVLPYFAIQLTKNKCWGNFTAVPFKSNFGLISLMAIFNFAASAVFAYAAYNLGDNGNTVGYAIYNTASVLMAVLGGLFAREWATAPAKSRAYLYAALAAMIVGVVLIALGNGAQ
ncbi:MAG: L-rhamnose/proton symporter RhaT [Rikenellaceae bacterium]